MSLSRITACKVAITCFLAMLISQVTLAGGAGGKNIPEYPQWLRTCDSLSRILAAPVFRPGCDYRWQPEYTAWIRKEGKEAVEQFMANYFIAINPVYTSRDASIPLYQAYESITFDAGFETADGDQFETQLVSDEVVDQPDLPANPGPDNRDMNWIVERSFDENGNVIAETKQFFDKSGRLLQTQEKGKHRDAASQTSTEVLASQPIRDAQGRDAANTMSAPINSSEFKYNPLFVQGANGAAYDYKNFDRFKVNGNETDKTNNPDAVGGQNTPGTLGWYYSLNNTWEPYTPTTNYPYTRQSYFRDGTGNIKKSAGAGEVFNMSSGHEVRSNITPVIAELNYYLQVRNTFFSSTELGSTPGTLVTEAIQTLSADPNGKVEVSIQDKGGKTLMSARPGSDLVVSNTATVEPGGIYYFRLFNPGNVSISSASNEFYNMETEQLVAIGTGGSISDGYYKVVNTGSSNITVNYSNGYANISYSFYNQLGQLIATIAPEGVKKLLVNGLNNYASKNDIPFITLNEYDVQGKMVKSTSPDRGATELVYRSDGKVRFSQNAEQKTNHRYSYINYDGLGRPIESGEYLPDANGIQFNSDISAVSNPMRDILEHTSLTGGLTTGTKKDIVMNLYDVIDGSHMIGGYVQNEQFLGNAISVTRKYSSIVNNNPLSSDLVSSTWFNYNEEGKIIWTINYIVGLGYKTLDFTYDVQGRLIQKDFQKGSPTEWFIHEYVYDAETQNLWKVYTRTNNTAQKQLQATYIYYLHGPLKRIELGDKLQGLDYTYTLQGALKAINNSNKTKDPGQDGSNTFEDAFGMVLDYFPGDYQNSRTAGIQSIIGVNTTGTPSYNGSIKAMTWFSKKPVAFSSIPKIEDPTTYIYQYDDKYQFTESTWGTDIGVTSPGSFQTTSINKEIIKNPTNGLPAYDANGNIQYLQRTDGTGAVSDNFTYNYLTNTNKLSGVVHNASSAPETYAQYGYDQLGQLTSEINTFQGTDRTKYIEYDVTGKVVAVYRNAAKQNQDKVVEYAYDAMGSRIIKKSYSVGQLSQITYYVGSVIYIQPVTNGTPGAITAQEYEIEGAGGRLGTFYRQIPVYAYELTDHLGNVRAVVAKNASSNSMEVRMYSDYYPFGMAMRGNPVDYRYGYQGQHAEKDEETDWNAFELRMYDGRIGRWLVTDPYGEFWSPYINVGNDPVGRTDPSGGCTGCPQNAKDGEYYYENGIAYQASIIKGEAVWAQVQSAVTIIPNYYSINYNTFLDRWQNKQPLVQTGDKAGYLTNVEMWRKVAQAQDEYWEAQEKVAKFIAWSLVPVGRIVGFAGKGALWLGSKTLASAGGRVFWSGLGGTASNAIKLTAEEFAANNGLKTLEMTWAGKALTGAQKTFGIPLKNALPAWGVLSKMWAMGARGTVHVIQDIGGTRLASQWATIEYPALKDGTTIIYHWY